jgi:hypothetical protein
LEVARKTGQVHLFDAAQQVCFVPWAAVVSCGGMVLVADRRRLDQHSPIALWLEFQVSAAMVKKVGNCPTLDKISLN